MENNLNPILNQTDQDKNQAIERNKLDNQYLNDQTMVAAQKFIEMLKSSFLTFSEGPKGNLNVAQIKEVEIIYLNLLVSMETLRKLLTLPNKPINIE